MISPLKKSRPGWSVIDLAVALFILLLLVGAAIPLLIQQHRNSHRAQCSYNLFQLGKAIKSFNELKGFLPPARIADDYATWMVLIAPYLEKKASDTDHPLESWEVERRYAEQFQAVREDHFKVMYCPARRRPSLLSTHGDGDPNVPGAVDDYACVSGDGNAAFPWTDAKANGPMILGEVLKEDNGKVLSWRGRTKLDTTSLKRGLSVTLLLGEKHVPLDDWGRVDSGDGSVYNGRHPASSARVAGPGFDLASEPADPFRNNFGGYHPGVCLFLQADMALRPVTAQITPEVLGRMMVREE